MRIVTCEVCQGPKIFRKVDGKQIVYCQCDVQRALDKAPDEVVLSLFRQTIDMFGNCMLLYQALSKQYDELQARVGEMANASVPKVKVDNIPNRVEPESAAEASNREAKLLAPGNQPVLHRGGTLKTNIQSLYGSDVPECPPSRDDTKPNPNTND